ncbi:MAG TPA: Dabb family protein [Acidimicrobiales bacterium]|nr:Dabb family protein [Acidimicrobiales bacterium]
MIRNVVMVKLRDGHDAAAVDALFPRFRALDCPGTVAYSVGRDLGLREGGWSFAIVADFVDEAAYRAYDLDEEHNRLRGELAAHAEAIARVQFAL